MKGAWPRLTPCHLPTLPVKRVQARNGRWAAGDRVPRGEEVEGRGRAAAGSGRPLGWAHQLLKVAPFF